ncbi:MAG: hypothetical protein AB7U31_03920 [Synergistaceae bacterium]
MRRISFNSRIGIIAALATAVVSILLVVITQFSFLGGLVVDQVSGAVRSELDVEIQMPPLTGNPIMGFKGDKVSLVRSGDDLLTIDKIEINLSLLSLLKNSPRVSTLVIEGLDTDYDSILKMVPEKIEGQDPGDIPIDKIKLNDVKVSSKWGLLELGDSSLELRGSRWFAPALKGKFKDIPFSIYGIMKKESGNWVLDGFLAKLDEGTVKISGAVWPRPDFKAEINGADIQKIASFFPGFSKYGVIGTLSAKMEMKGEGKDIFIMGEGILKKAVLGKVLLQEVAAKWRYEEGVLDVTLNESKVFESSITGILKLDTRTPDKYLELKAAAKNLRFSDWTDKIPNEIVGNASRLNGSISAVEADLKGPLNALVGKIEIAPSNASYNKMKFTSLQGKAIFDGQPSGVVDLTALNEGREIRVTGTVSFAEGLPVDLKLDAKAIRLEELSKAVEELEKYDLNGTADISAIIRGKINAMKVTADINSSSAEIKDIGTLIRVKLSPEYDLSDGTFTLRNTSFLWNGAHISASGTIKKSNGTQEFSLSGAIKNVSLNKFHDTLKFFKTMGISGDAAGSWALKGKIDSPEILLKLRAAKGSFRGLNVDKFYTEMTYSSGKLDFSKMEAKTGRGSAELKCEVILPVTSQNGSPSSPLKWDVKGRIKEVDLSALNDLFNAGQDMDGPCSGELKIADDGSGLKWSADIRSDGVRWHQFASEEAHASIKGDTGGIKIDKATINFLRGKHSISGSVTYSAEGKSFSDSTLNLMVSSENINMYELLRRHLPVVRGVQGLIKSEIRVSGTIEKPLYTGSGTFAPFRYRGFLLPMLDVAIQGSMTDVNITEAKARLKTGELSAKGRVFLKNGEWHGVLDTNGIGIDLRQIGVYLPEQFRERLGGNVNFKFTGKGEVDNFAGEGFFSSERMRFLGIRIKNIKAPFYISDGYAVMEDVKAETNGGTVSGGLAMDINKSTWGGNLTVLSADVAPMIKQAFPSLKGSISGNGDLKIRAGGETGRMSTVDVAGVLFLRNGEISGFEAVEASKKYIKGKPLLFKTLQSAFTFDEGYLTILPGSQAVAPPGDQVYRYVMVDGLVNNKKEMSLFAMGKVNIQALNALLGALQGIINVGMEYTGEIDRSALLQDFLGGVLSGFTKTDFRFVTMNINGKMESPQFSNVKVDKSEHMTSPRNLIPKSASDPNEKDYSSRDTVFRLKFEIPVGPGVSYTNGNNIGGQIIEQTLGNILQGIDFGN